MKSYRQLLEEHEDFIDEVCESIQACEKRWNLLAYLGWGIAIPFGLVSIGFFCFSFYLLSVLCLGAFALFTFSAFDAKNSKNRYVTEYQSILSSAIAHRDELRACVKMENGDYWKQ